MRENVVSIVKNVASTTPLSTAFGSSSRLPSQQEMEKKAKEFAAYTGESYEVVLKRIKEFYKLEGREIVVVYKFGPGKEDFSESKILADMRADEISPGDESKKAFAWKDPENGELSLAKTDELLKFKKDHPGFKFPDE